MATQIYMSITGSVQGKFKGQQPNQNRIPILDFSMGVESPVDQRTGQASGKRQRKPLIVSVSWGNWSPQIFSAMLSNEDLQIKFKLNTGSTGSVEVIKLRNATVTNVSTQSGSSGGQVQDITIAYQSAEIGTSQYTSSSDDWELERVIFTFQQINVGGIGKSAAADDWTM